MSLKDWRGLGVLFTTINVRSVSYMYWRKWVFLSINKLFNDIHSKSGRLKGNMHWRKIRSTRINKLAKWIHSNKDIMTFKVIKIWVRVPNNGCFVIFVIYLFVFRGKDNGNKSSSVNIISCINNQRSIDTLILKVIRIIITWFPTCVIARGGYGDEETFLSWGVVSSDW